MKKNSTFYKAWRLIYPLLIYQGIAYVIIYAATFLVTATLIMRQSGTAASELLNDVLTVINSYTLELNALAALVSAPILYLFYRLDKKKAGIITDIHYEKTLLWKYILIIPLGLASCYAGNNFITMSGLYQVSESTEALFEVLYQGRLLVEILGIGILIPIVEELIFRGLMFKRLKEWLPLTWAYLLTSLLFALYHGDLVQGVYAFFLSLLLIYVYERYHNLAAPVLFHIAANLLSVLGSELNFLDVFFTSRTLFYASTLAACCIIVLMVYLIERYTKPGQKGTEKVSEDKAKEDNPARTYYDKR